MLGVHEHVLDFEILETGNPKTLVFLDSSQYMEAPERPLIEVILPGYTKYLLANVVASTVNTFNSSTIGLNTVLVQAGLVDLPDGIWQFKFKICPYKYINITKNVLRVTQLIIKLNTLYTKIDLSVCQSKEDKQMHETLVHIHVLIEGARAEANANCRKAQSYYQLANELVNKLLDKYCLNCPR
jgi:hypothetical protein